MNRVLVVDDESTLAYMIARILNGHGWRAVGVDDPEKALGLIQDFDVVLTDLTMPIVTGFSIAARARALGIPVVGMTGWGDDEKWQGPLLTKPFHHGDLLAIMAQVVQKAVPA